MGGGASQLAVSRNGGWLSDFCVMLACWRWVWWGVLSEFAETKKNLSACNAKSKGSKAKDSM